MGTRCASRRLGFAGRLLVALPTVLFRSVVCCSVLCSSVLCSSVLHAQAACPNPLSNPELIRAAEVLGGGSKLDTGAAGDALVASAVDAVCDETTRKYAGAACLTQGGLPDLRRRVVLDALRLPASAYYRPGLNSEQREQLALLSALIDTWLTEGKLGDFVARLGSPPVKTETLLRGDCSLPTTQAQLPHAVIPLRVAWESVDLDVTQAQAKLQAALPSVSPAGLSAFADLLTQIKAPGSPDVSVRYSTWLGLLSDSYRVAGLELPSVVASFPFGSGKLGLLDMPEVIHRLGEFGGGITLPTSVETSLEVLYGVAVASDEAQAKRAIAKAVLDLGPWADHFLLDLNLGAASLSDRGYTFAGDALLGYQVEAFGGDARGALYEYDLGDANSFLQISQREVGVEGWLGLGSPQWTFEARIEGKYVYLDSTRLDPGGDFLDETSNLARGLLLLGLRAQPATTAAVGAWVGGGYQYEDYSPLLVSTTQQVLLSDETRSTLVLEARLRAQLDVWPRYLALRARADFVRYSVGRQTESTLLQPGSVQNSQSAEEVTTTELHARGFLDIEAARFFGFVPGLFGGVDYLSIESDASSVSGTSPVFGAGVRQVSF
ncbi:MAG: hypothetical protein H6716_25500 [Polyangiaceae bacterium]|nr:hypothetical protein [Polyangiaceae bacterium]